MKEQNEKTNSDSPENLLIEMEKSVLEAFKNKKDADFTKNFSKDYIGVANDGIKNTDDEIAGMHKLDLKKLWMTDENVLFPIEKTAILTYKMMAEGTLDGKEFSGTIYTSTVYVNKEDKWSAVLHTESMSQ